MSKKKLVNNTIYPQHIIENIARCLFPDMQAFFASEEGQREFAEWKAEQDKKRAADNSVALSFRHKRKQPPTAQRLLRALPKFGVKKYSLSL